jgi:hypothetical protein
MGEQKRIQSTNAGSKYGLTLGARVGSSRWNNFFDRLKKGLSGKKDREKQKSIFITTKYYKTVNAFRDFTDHKSHTSQIKRPLILYI